VIVVVKFECVGCSLVSVGRKLLLELVVISIVVWSITWTVAEAERVLLVNIVGGLLADVVVELEFVGCSLVIVGETLLVKMVAISNIFWLIT
jgi:hypothetical protein